MSPSKTPPNSPPLTFYITLWCYTVYNYKCMRRTLFFVLYLGFPSFVCIWIMRGHLLSFHLHTADRRNNAWHCTSSLIIKTTADICNNGYLTAFTSSFQKRTENPRFDNSANLHQNSKNAIFSFFIFCPFVG